MSANNLENTSIKRKKFLKGKFGRQFIIITLFLVISVVTVVYSTRPIFQTDISSWTIVQGNFSGEDHTMKALHYQLNWAYHQSLVAYGVWQWSFRYFGSGSASIIFIGSTLDGNYSQHPTQGYELIFHVGQKLALNKLTGSTSSEEINSTYITIEPSIVYQMKIIRLENNTFSVFINNELKLFAIDDTYTTSEVLFLDWTNRHTLEWIMIDDQVAENGWHDFFSGLPSIYSSNIFTMISLYLPFVALLLVIAFYLFRLFFAQENWTRFIIPLFIAIIIGSGYGFLMNYIRENMPEIPPETIIPTDPTTDIPTGTGTPTSITGDPFTPSPTTPNPTGSPTNGNFQGIPRNIISIVLMVIAGPFIIVSIVYVAIDFFKRREEEFHESLIDKDERYIPSASTSDHRRRVIRAYHQASYSLIDEGAKSEKSMTPSEFGFKAKDQIPLTDDSLENLTDLYEEARYSIHEITADESKQAESHFEKITDDLEGKKEKSSKNKSETSTNNSKGEN